MDCKMVKAEMTLRSVRVADLAKGTGIPKHRLYRKLRGEGEFRRSEMAAVAAFLECDPGMLFFGDGHGALA